MGRTFRWLPEVRGDGAFQLALDEVLWKQGGAALRFYRWDPPALSLGYFQSADEGAQAARETGLTLLRRPTGGGAIAHVDELTFCLVDRVGEGVFSGRVAEDTRRLHRVFARVLSEGCQDGAHTADAAVQHSVDLRGSARLRSDRGDSGWLCFHRSSALDLVSAERKLLGSAARRARGRVLQHGSLPLAPNPLARSATSVEELWGEAVEFSVIANRLADALAAEYGWHLVEEPLTDFEREQARDLAQRRYRNRTWTERR